MSVPISSETREEQLVQWCQDQIAYSSHFGGVLGRRLRRYRALVLFVSVSVTVLSGISQIKDHWPWSVTVAAGLSTFFAGLLTISKTEESVVNNLSRWGQLRRELLLYQQEAGIYEGMEPHKQRLTFAERLTSIDEASWTESLKQYRSETKSG